MSILRKPRSARTDFRLRSISTVFEINERRPLNVVRAYAGSPQNMGLVYNRQGVSKPPATLHISGGAQSRELMVIAGRFCWITSAIDREIRRGRSRGGWPRSSSAHEPVDKRPDQHEDANREDQNHERNNYRNSDRHPAEERFHEASVPSQATIKRGHSERPNHIRRDWAQCALA